MTVTINNYQFTLLSEKALYKEEEQLLIIADVHLGKASHFRKEGISIPADAQLGDYEKLEQLFRKVNPLKVYFLGDLFHSTFNRDWHHFCDLVKKFPGITFTLVKGNHDLIDEKLFNDICVHVVLSIEDSAFVYTHEPLTTVPQGKFNISGHIHPGITIFGAGRQSIKLPCFYITDQLLILPAFGLLTGLCSMEKTAGSTVYAVVQDSICKV